MTPCYTANYVAPEVSWLWMRNTKWGIYIWRLHCEQDVLLFSYILIV
jgi:hypothetical protein